VPPWLAETETTNEQFRRFRPEFDCGYYQKRHARDDDMGLALNHARQPAVRVSWEQAMAFCDWLSARTGLRVILPTEAQWEWAGRAGTDTPFFFGGIGADFSPWANLADAAFGRGGGGTRKPAPGRPAVTRAVRRLPRWPLPDF
jgi:formylglycine-generating enzyme required for sulfatase activity